MRLDHLNYLIEIARCKSISAAAKKLYISQTGLSAVVNSVETELSLQIFRRTNKGIILTEEGERAIALMQEIIQKEDELHLLSQEESARHQIINLGVFPSGVYALSTYLVKNWSAKHRNTHLHIYEIGCEEMHECISSHTASIVIGAESQSYFNPSYLSKSGKVYVEPVYEDHFCVLVSADSELASRSSVDLEELLDRHLLLTHTYPNPQDKPIGYILHRFRRFTVLSSVEIAKHVLAENPDIIMITPMLSLCGDKEIERGELCAVPVTGFETALTIYLMCDISSKLSLQETQLMQEIRKFFASLQYGGEPSTAPS